MDKVVEEPLDGLQGEVEATQSTTSGTPELTPAQNPTKAEPKTDVLALGTRAMGRPNF